LFHAPCSMNISDYIEKLKRKPEKEKEKIAIIATAVSFVIILAIWLISFSETNRSLEEKNSPNAQNQFQNLNSNLKEGKQSIQNMLQQIPSQTEPLAEPAPQNNTAGENMPSGSDVQTNQPASLPDEAGQNSAQDSQGQIPQLP
jgi:hypothetical protein